MGEWIRVMGIGRPLNLPDGALVMVRQTLGGPSYGPHKVELVDWPRAAEYRVAAGMANELVQLQIENEALRGQLEDAQIGHKQAVGILTDQLEALRTGADAAANLSRLYQVNAEVREARALRDYASMKLEHALLREQIASAISRGHLPSNFYNQLREWCK